jgi:hypothetical protein
MPDYILARHCDLTWRLWLSVSTVASHLISPEITQLNLITVNQVRTPFLITKPTAPFVYRVWNICEVASSLGNGVAHCVIFRTLLNYIFTRWIHRSRPQRPRGLRLAHSNTGVVGSNPTRSMDVCLLLFCVHVVLCVGSGLATGRSSVQGALKTMHRIKKPKRGQGPKRAIDK